MGGLEHEITMNQQKSSELKNYGEVACLQVIGPRTLSDSVKGCSCEGQFNAQSCFTVLLCLGQHRDEADVVEAA